MQNASIILALSVLLIVGGRTLMIFDRRARSEGIFSCVVGIGLSLGWYQYHPSDFGEFTYTLTHRFHWMMGADDGGPTILMALVPAALGIILLIVAARSGR